MCDCQQSSFWKWTYCLLFVALLIIVFNLLCAIWGVERELKELNQWEKKKELAEKSPEEKTQEWAKIFDQIGKAFEEDRKNMENDEKVKQWKRKYAQLKPGETYQGLTKEDIKRMLKKLGYW